MAEDCTAAHLDWLESLKLGFQKTAKLDDTAIAVASSINNDRVVLHCSSQRLIVHTIAAAEAKEERTSGGPIVPTPVDKSAMWTNMVSLFQTLKHTHTHTHTLAIVWRQQ